jgi:hypothetical protein
MGKTEKEQSDAMKRYIREVFIPAYAQNFNKGLDTNDILFYGKIHFNRERSDKASFMHCHLIVSRKDQLNKKKLSPLTNHRDTNKGVIKGGFDRKNLFQQAESGFDKLFGYQRDLRETFTYCNTMKNGSMDEKLEMQEKKINKEINPQINIPDLSSVFGLLMPEGDNRNCEEQPFVPFRKKKKKRRGISK